MSIDENIFQEVADNCAGKYTESVSGITKWLRKEYSLSLTFTQIRMDMKDDLAAFFKVNFAVDSEVSRFTTKASEKYCFVCLVF